MPFVWSDFDTLASWLAAHRTDEASQRSAISRAYYFAYHSASHYIRSNNLVPRSQRLSHGLVWTVIRDCGKTGARQLADRGLALRNTRVAADYKLSFPGDLQKQMQDSILEARELVQLIDNLQLAGCGT